MTRSLLPGDLKPQPVFISGMLRLLTGFTGAGLFVLRPSDSATTFINYLADGSWDAAAFDAFRGGQICRVLVRDEQMSGANLSAQGPDVAKAPKIGGLTIGNHRCMWMEGDGQVIVGAPVNGQIYGMSSPTLSDTLALGDEVTVIQVVKPHSGMFCNQALAPGLQRGTTFAMSRGSTEMLRIRSDGQGNGATFGAGWGARQGNDFIMRASDSVIETCPTILTYICKQGVGTFIAQNEDMKSGFEFSTTGLLGNKFWIGYHESSEQAQTVHVGLSEAGGFAELLTMVWNRALTFRQAAQVRSLLYPLIPIDRRRSRWNAPLVLTLTDSLWAGYQGDDLRAWDSYAQLTLPTSIRWANYAVPGSAMLPGASTPAMNHTLGAFDGWIAQTIKAHKGKVHCVWGAPINDYYVDNPPPSTSPIFTPAQAYNQGTLGLMAKIRAIDPTATFTLATATRATGFANDTWTRAVGDLIRAGGAANGYNVAEFTNDPVLAVSPGPAYSDGAHLTNLGHQREAQILTPFISAWATALGVT